MRASARELLVPFLTPLVWRDRGANPRPTAPEADALTTRLSGPDPFIYFFSIIDIFLLASLVGFEPARQRYIASQKPNTLLTELSSRDHFLARFCDICAFFHSKSHEYCLKERKNRTDKFSSSITFFLLKYMRTISRHLACL